MKKIILLFVFVLPVILFSATQINAYDFRSTVRLRNLTNLRLHFSSLRDSRISNPSTPSPTNQPTPTSTSRPTATPRPTLQPTPQPTTTPRPTPVATPKPTPTSTPRPTTAPSSSTDSVQSFIMNEINDYRKSQGLSAVKTDPYTCNFAKTRAQEITSNFNHDGFRNRIDNKTLPYPSYSRVTENIAMTSDYKQVVSMWINSSGHAENMRQDTPYVCVERNGNYYAYEGWKP